MRQKGHKSDILERKITEHLMFEFFALLFRTVRLAHITNTVQL